MGSLGPINGLVSERTTDFQYPSFDKRLSRGEVDEEELRNYYKDFAEVQLIAEVTDFGIDIRAEGFDSNRKSGFPGDLLSLRAHVGVPTFYVDGDQLDWERGQFSFGSRETALTMYGVSVEWSEIEGREQVSVRVTGSVELRTEDEAQRRLLERIDNHFPFDITQKVEAHESARQ